MDQRKIGSFLKRLRNEKGITQEQAAEKFGVTQRTVSRWETGSNMPDISMLVYLAEFYEVDVREIIDGERKSEKMNEEIKETIEKVADYKELLVKRTFISGSIAIGIVYALLDIIAAIKGVSSAALSSLMCAYLGVIFVVRSKQKKKDLIIGFLLCMASLVYMGYFIVYVR